MYVCEIIVQIYILYKRLLINKTSSFILKCILIKFQGENSLRISVFIATTTKKQREDGACAAMGNFLRNGANLVHFKVYFN